jgi:hypothetical protein
MRHRSGNAGAEHQADTVLLSLPPEAARALRNLFISVTEIEAILLLRARADEIWDAGQLGRSLRLEPSHASTVLHGLADRGFLRRTKGGYSYDPATHGLEAAVDQIASLRPGERVAAVALVFSRPRKPVSDFG